MEDNEDVNSLGGGRGGGQVGFRNMTFSSESSNASVFTVGEEGDGYNRDDEDDDERQSVEGRGQRKKGNSTRNGIKVTKLNLYFINCSESALEARSSQDVVPRIRLRSLAQADSHTLGAVIWNHQRGQSSVTKTGPVRKVDDGARRRSWLRHSSWSESTDRWRAANSSTYWKKQTQQWRRWR